MNEGDRVILQQSLGPCQPGCEGVVTYVDSNNRVTVKIIADKDCNPITVLLPPQDQSYYKLGKNCP